MTAKTKTTAAAQIATLTRKNMELEAQLAHVYHFAKVGIASANRTKTLGSSVIVRLTYLGGREVCSPFALKDGFSDETIAALTGDMKYSYEKTLEFKP